MLFTKDTKPPCHEGNSGENLDLEVLNKHIW